MKKFNRNLIITGVIASILVVLATATFIVFAAFSFSKTVEEDDSLIGGVEINSRSIISYAQEYEAPTTQADYTTDFFRKIKLRTDSVCNVEGLKVNKDSSNNISISVARATAYNSKNAMVNMQAVDSNQKLQLTSTTTDATFTITLSFT